MLALLRARYRGLVPGLQLFGTRADGGPANGPEFTETAVEPAEFISVVFVITLKALDKDVYDLYPEYEDEEYDGSVTSPSRLLSANKQTLNINVGGTVYLIPCRLAARYPRTRIGRLATYTDHSRKLDLCDDYIIQSNEFFFDRDPKAFHSIFTFYRTGVLWIRDELCPRSFLEEINYWGVRICSSRRCCRVSFEERYQ
ncbi:hypothetical protein LDENG_00136230 [Lucifuga dentata]|nr:hypothetical protein LDENG_00136230 [Lucifuga dentata]